MDARLQKIITKPGWEMRRSMIRESTPDHVENLNNGRNPSRQSVSTLARLFYFFLIYIPTLFVPTVEVLQLKQSWGRVPLWYAYPGLGAPDFFAVSLFFVCIHIAVSILVSAYLANRFSSWCTSSKIKEWLVALDLIQK